MKILDPESPMHMAGNTRELAMVSIKVFKLLEDVPTAISQAWRTDMHAARFLTLLNQPQTTKPARPTLNVSDMDPLV